MICTSCGKELPDDVYFCGYCGVHLRTGLPAPSIDDLVQPHNKNYLAKYSHMSDPGAPNEITFIFIVYAVFSVIMLVQAIMGIKILSSIISWFLYLNAPNAFFDLSIANTVLTYLIFIGTVLGFIFSGRAKYIKNLEKQTTGAYHTHTCSLILLILNSIFILFELFVFIGLIYLVNQSGNSMSIWIIILYLFGGITFAALSFVCLKKSKSYKNSLKELWYSLNPPK